MIGLIALFLAIYFSLNLFTDILSTLIYLFILKENFKDKYKRYRIAKYITVAFLWTFVFWYYN